MCIAAANTTLNLLSVVNLHAAKKPPQTRPYGQSQSGIVLDAKLYDLERHVNKLQKDKEILEKQRDTDFIPKINRYEQKVIEMRRERQIYM